MKACTPGATEQVDGDDTGESCSIVVTQPPSDPGGWFIHVSARGDGASDAFTFVRDVVLTAPALQCSRLVARIFVPGASRWRASVQPPALAKWIAPVKPANIEVGLRVSKRPFASTRDIRPIGKGFGAATGAAPGTAIIPPGAEVREIASVAGVGGSTAIVTVPRDATTSATLPTFTVPPADTWRLPEETLEGLVGPASVVFGAGTIAFSVVWVE